MIEPDVLSIFYFRSGFRFSLEFVSILLLDWCKKIMVFYRCLWIVFVVCNICGLPLSITIIILYKIKIVHIERLSNTSIEHHQWTIDESGNWLEQRPFHYRSARSFFFISRLFLWYWLFQFILRHWTHWFRNYFVVDHLNRYTIINYFYVFCAFIGHPGQSWKFSLVVVVVWLHKSWSINWDPKKTLGETATLFAAGNRNGGRDGENGGRCTLFASWLPLLGAMMCPTFCKVQLYGNVELFFILYPRWNNLIGCSRKSDVAFVQRNASSSRH